MDHELIKASHRLSELDILIDVDGYTIRVCWFRVMFKENDWFIRRHAHTTYEFHFIARGECQVLHDGGAFVLGAGGFFLTGPRVPHTQRSTGTGELVEYSLNCEIRPPETPDPPAAGEMAWLLRALSGASCAPTADRYGALALFQTALREAGEMRPGYGLTVKNLVIMILVAAARSLCTHRSAGSAEVDPAGTDDSRLARIESFIGNNVGRDLTPQDVAEHMALSERQLGRIVLRHKGYSTKKLITRIKLRRAKALLADTDMTLREIAWELGFSSEYYFNSVFKKHEGFPPGAFRSSMRGR
jgi:AraC-like DNA-binding protein